MLFLSFGAVALVVIGRGMGGFRRGDANRCWPRPPTAPLLTRERVSPLFFLSYTFIPLSTIAFPHITIFCLTARRMAQFKRTVDLLSALHPGDLAAVRVPRRRRQRDARRAARSQQKLEARAGARGGARRRCRADERAALRRQAAGDDVMLVMLERYAPLWLAGLLGAGIMAAVMASDSQILALSTMFTEDVFAFYGGNDAVRRGRAGADRARLFVVLLTIVAYAIALRAPQSIFDLAVQFAFSGYAALSPLLFAALFWKRSTKWGALAVTLWVAVRGDLHGARARRAGLVRPDAGRADDAHLVRADGGRVAADAGRRRATTLARYSW